MLVSDSSAQGCFILCELAAQLHLSERKKIEVPVRIRDATGTIKNCFESFPEALFTLNRHLKVLEAEVAPISPDLIFGQTWFPRHEVPTIIPWSLVHDTRFTRRKEPWNLNETNNHLRPRMKPLNLYSVIAWRQSSSAECWGNRKCIALLSFLMEPPLRVI